MREKLNENPMAQLALVGVLLLVGVLVFLKPLGGGGEEEEAESSSSGAVATVNGVTAAGATPGEAVENAVSGVEEGSISSVTGSAIPTSVPAPPPPAAYRDAYRSGKTVVLLVVHDGGIDDNRTANASAVLSGMSDIALFEVPLRQLPRYASVTIGLEINRTPALVVVRPKQLSGGVPQASVDYGLQTEKSVEQAVRDATYKGPEETYHPE